jgi:hypothetical protein
MRGRGCRGISAVIDHVPPSGARAAVPAGTLCRGCASYFVSCDLLSGFARNDGQQHPTEPDRRDLGRPDLRLRKMWRPTGGRDRSEGRLKLRAINAERDRHCASESRPACRTRHASCCQHFSRVEGTDRGPKRRKHREPERLAIRAERHALRSIPQALFRTTVRSRNPAEKVMALGSGFIIDPADYIVTNNHIVANADKVAVIFR